MRLEGKIFAGDRVKKSAIVPVIVKDNIPFTKSLDLALVSLCHTLKLPNVVWLSKNTREFSRYRQTIFSDEQFSEAINFTQFQIKLIENE